MQVKKVGDWLKIEGKNAQGEPNQTAINTSGDGSIDFIETGAMHRKTELGNTAQQTCVVIHFGNGRDLGMPTDDPVELMAEILKLLGKEEK